MGANQLLAGTMVARQPLGEKNGNSVIKFDGNDVEYVKKSRKLKGQKLAKFQKLSKSEKSKSEKL